MSGFKSFVKSLTPPIVLDTFMKYNSQSVIWHGAYRTWQEAEQHCTGYNDDAILQKVRNSLLKVKYGEAVYERDSVLFDEIQYSWQLLTGLMYAQAKTGRLEVLDFGGSLGSSYFQNKKFLSAFDVSWSIVEQPHFVKVGQQDFADNQLTFFYDIDECFAVKSPNILLLSGVLQYLERPYIQLQKLLSYPFDYVIVDLTAVSCSDEILTVQTIKPPIYHAKYPCWMLDKQKIGQIFDQCGYYQIEKFQALDGYKVLSSGKQIGCYYGEIRERIA